MDPLIRRTRNAVRVPIEERQQTTGRTTVAESFRRRQRAQPRSKQLLEAVAALDTQMSPAVRQQVMAWIDQEYADRQGGQLIGLFGRCYLGPPFVDHQVSLAGLILEHFRPEDRVPGPFGRARVLVRNLAYQFIEIYSDGEIVPIRSDGKAG